MSHIGYGPEDPAPDGSYPPPVPAAPSGEPAEVRLPRAGSRRAEPERSRRGRGCLPLLVVLALVAAGIYFGGSWAVDKVRSLTGSSPDYSSTSTVIDEKNAVTVEVRTGDSATDIGGTLENAGVVKSVEAFVDAANADERSLGIQVGYYLLNKEMKASAALSVLVDPANLIQNSVTIPEGFRLDQIVKRIVEKTDFTRKQVRAAMQDPAALGLPAEAGGTLEGYLFPATYNVLPKTTAKDLLTQMVAKTKQVEQSLDIAAKAKRLGLTPHEVLTLASILEYEAGKDEDYPKVARVLYNRLEIGQKLQLDSTVAFANKITGRVYTTAEERAIDSPYNTYANAGLPPGPIGAAGERAIEAALNPARGDWLFFVVVDLDTGETRFNTTYADHLADDAVFDQWCRDHPGRC